MIYLTVAGSYRDAARFRDAGVGVMLTPLSGPRLDYVRTAGMWAADNGCFSRGAAFDLSAYLSWLDAMRDVAHMCLFATAPDVVGDALATWERSRAVLPLIRSLGYPAAVVAQNGWDASAVDWDAFDVLFVGGTDAWKLAPAIHGIVAEAKAHGKWVHIGRVNSWRRLASFMLSSADSADGTTLAFNRERYIPEVLRWASRLSAQLVLPGIVAGVEGRD